MVGWLGGGGGGRTTVPAWATATGRVQALYSEDLARVDGGARAVPAVERREAILIVPQLVHYSVDRVCTGLGCPQHRAER